MAAVVRAAGGYCHVCGGVHVDGVGWRANDTGECHLTTKDDHGQG